MVLAKDIPDIFSGTGEVDEPYLGGAWKNKRKVVRDMGRKRSRGTSKQPVFGILCRNGQVWAEIVENVDESTLLPLITEKVALAIIASFSLVPARAFRDVIQLFNHHGERGT